MANRTIQVALNRFSESVLHLAKVDIPEIGLKDVLVER